MRDQGSACRALHQHHTHTLSLALSPLVKRQVFCVGDRLKMVKHQAWATTIVAPKLVGSKWGPVKLSQWPQKDRWCQLARWVQLRPRQERTAKAMSWTYDCIQYSYRPDLQKKSQKKNSTVETHYLICEAAKLEHSVSKFKIDTIP